MSSENGSSSAVRNLRSIFENKASLDSTSPDPRGRSPSGLGSDKENGEPPTGKIRASFVSVEPVGSMATTIGEDGSDLTRQSSAGLRRGSFSEANGNGTLSELRKTVSEQQADREVSEGAVESAAVTPIRKPEEGQFEVDDSPLNDRGGEERAHLGRPATGAEEEANDTKPADPTSEDAVSGGKALPPVTQDLKSSPGPTASSLGKKSGVRKAMTNGKSPAIPLKSTPKPSSNSAKSPAAQPKTPSSVKPSTSSAKPESPKSKTSKTSKAPTNKTSRSSLTAPTAASMAHSKAASDKSDKSSSSKTSPTSKTKPREVTKPVNLPSHLTAPTAASRARHEHVPAPTSANDLRASTTSRPKQPASSRITSRSSLPPQQNRESKPPKSSAPRHVQPSGGSFLERMMKPTAASAGKSHEKAEPKSPTRTKAAAPKPKTNGHAIKPATKASAASASSKAALKPQKEGRMNGEASVEAAAVTTAEMSGPTFASAGPTGLSVATEAVSEAGGNETALPYINGHADGALEATPSGLDGEETIR